MKCTRCNSEIPEGNLFCGSCGERVSAPAAPVVPPQPVAPVYTAPETPAYVPPASPVPPVQETGDQAPAQKKKGGKGWLIGLIIALVAVVGVVVTGFLTDWFGLGAKDPGEDGETEPLREAASIEEALENLWNSGNFTASFQMESEGEEISGTLYLDMEQELTLLLDLAYDDQPITVAVTDGRLVLNYGGEIISQDISDQLDEFMAGTGDADEVDVTQLLLSLLFGSADPEYYEDYLDLDELEASLDVLGNELVNTDWLEKHLGYKVEQGDGTAVYSFRVNVYSLLETLLPYFEDVFLEEDDYTDFRESMLEDSDDMASVEFALSLTVDDQYLKNVVFQGFEDSEEMMKISVEFTNIGTTEPEVSSEMTQPEDNQGTAAQPEDFTNFTLDFYVDVNLEDTQESMYCVMYAQVDPENIYDHSIYITMEYDGEMMEVGMYNGYVLYRMDGQTYGEDISGQLEEALAQVEEYLGEYTDTVSDPEALWDALIAYLAEAIEAEDTEDILDETKLEDCILKLMECIQDEQWLEENLGYSVHTHGSTTTYSFEIDAYDAMIAVMECCEELFRDPDVFTEGMESARNDADTMGEIPQISLSLTTENDIPTDLSLSLWMEEEYVYMGISLYDIGTTDYHESILREMLQEAGLATGA